MAQKSLIKDGLEFGRPLVRARFGRKVLFTCQSGLLKSQLLELSSYIEASTATLDIDYFSLETNSWSKPTSDELSDFEDILKKEFAGNLYYLRPNLIPTFLGKTKVYLMKFISGFRGG